MALSVTAVPFPAQLCSDWEPVGSMVRSLVRGAGPAARGQGLISKQTAPRLPDCTGEQCCSVLSLSDPFPVIERGADELKHDLSLLNSSHTFMGRTCVCT